MLNVSFLRWTLTLSLILVGAAFASKIHKSEPDAPPPEELVVRIVSDDPVAIVRPSERDSTQLLVRNEGDEPVRGTLHLGTRLRPDAVVNYTHEQTLSLNSGATRRLPLPEVLIGDLGIKYLDWKVSGGKTRSGRTSFAHMKPVGATPQEMQPIPPDEEDEFIFGLAGGMRAYRKHPFKKRFFRAAAIIGAETYRVDMSWNYLQPDPDTWRWEGLDEVVQLARANGMFIQPLVAYGNEWAVSEETRALAEKRGDSDALWRYPPKLEHWARFTRRLAERYGTRMQYYEIWNEADIRFFRGNAEQYLKLLQTGYEQIKAADPNILVTTAGFTSMEHPDLNREVQELALTRGRDHFDALAWHKHSSFDGFQNEVDSLLLPWLRKIGHAGTPLVFNESALGREFKRRYELAFELVKKMSFSWSRGAIGHYWYNLVRSAPNYQMLNQDWTPRPSYPAYNELARMLRGRHFSHALELGKGRWGFAFRGEGTFTGDGEDDWVVVLWTEDEAREPAEVAVPASPQAKVHRVGVMGNREPVAVEGRGRVLTAVEHEPAYLVIENSTVTPNVTTSK